MTLPSCNALIALALMLMIGVGLGMLIMSSPPASVQTVIEASQAAATPVWAQLSRPPQSPSRWRRPCPERLSSMLG